MRYPGDNGVGVEDLVGDDDAGDSLELNCGYWYFENWDVFGNAGNFLKLRYGNRVLEVLESPLNARVVYSQKRIREQNV